VEMQNHADVKGRVAVDDITLWTNRCTKCHRNSISCSHLLAHYVSGGWIFHRKLYSMIPTGFWRYFWSTATTLTL